MKNILLVLLIMTLTTSGFSQSIEKENSKVEFKIGGILWTKVNGTITNMKGTVNFDEANLSKASFDVSVDVKTLNTGNDKRDEHLKTKDFFEVEQYPRISFKSISVSKTDKAYVTKGKLSIKDVTKEISIPFQVVKTGSTTSLIGEFEINRLDYNVGIDQSTMMVDKNVNITIICVLE